MHQSKITPDERAELIRLHHAGSFEEMKALSLRLGVSEYYGTILARRKRHPYERSRKRWSRAMRNGPVLA